MCFNTDAYPSLVEGIGLENRKVSKGTQGFESLSIRHIAEQSSLVARQSHNLKDVGSNPTSATNGPVVYRLTCLSVTEEIAGSIPVWTAIKVSQLSQQSKGLKILVSTVQFCPKPPYKRLLESFFILKNLHLLGFA